MKNSDKKGLGSPPICYIAVGLLLCIFVMVLFKRDFLSEFYKMDSGKERFSSTADILYINGTPVTNEEYQMLLKRNQGIVLSGYSSEDINQKDFWLSKPEGESPIQELQILVEEELRHNMAVKELSREEGLIDNFTYRNIKENMLEENSKRSKGCKREDIFYGISSFEPESYYQYFYSSMESKLTYLMQKKQTVSEKELLARYEGDKHSKYSYETQVTAITAELDPDTCKNIEEAEQILEKVAEELKKNPSLEQCKEEFPGVMFTMLTMNSLDTQAGKSGIYKERWKTAQKLKQGQTSSVYPCGGSYAVMYCISRTDEDFLSYEEQKGIIQLEIKMERVKKRIEEKSREFEITYHQVNLDRAVIEFLKEKQG